ncbi:hypothetical protein MDL68_09610, partial [Streptococcus suis]|nr:hypothetical protein [Streptococcus suis]
MNDNEVRKAPDALERVPEMLDTPPNRYHCISKTPQQTLGAFFYHLSSSSRYLTKNILCLVIQIRKLFSFGLKLRVKKSTRNE